MRAMAMANGCRSENGVPANGPFWYCRGHYDKIYANRKWKWTLLQFQKQHERKKTAI